jgi:hypothetical protein
MSYDTGVLAALAIFGVFGAIIGIAFYVFYAFALYKLAQKRGVDMAWLAWIPVAQMYVIGKMVKTVKISTFEVPSLEIVLPVGMLAAMLLGAIPLIGWLIYLAFLVLVVLTAYNLYKQYVPEQAVLYTVLSIFGITIPFFFLKFSKMDPVNLP